MNLDLGNLFFLVALGIIVAALVLGNCSAGGTGKRPGAFVEQGERPDTERPSTSGEPMNPGTPAPAEVTRVFHSGDRVCRQCRSSGRVSTVTLIAALGPGVRAEGVLGRWAEDGSALERGVWELTGAEVLRFRCSNGHQWEEVAP